MGETKNSWHKVDTWDREIEVLQQIIAKTPLVETTKWGGPVYTFQDKNVVGVGAFKNHFALWFYNGVFLKDPLNKLHNAQEEKTKAMRQWRFTSKEEILENEVLAYLNEAIEIAKQNITFTPEKKALVISDFFQEQLLHDPAVKTAFEQLTPGKQKEYVEFIDSAKQEKTKFTRIEKIKPMILANIGLNDKYK